MEFTRDEKVDTLRILISAISVIASFILSLDYLAWIAVILCGTPILKECVEGLITEFDIKADLLVSIAIIASLIIGEVFAAGEIATIMAIGGFLEEYTVKKSQMKIEELIRLTPHFATRIRNNLEEKIPVEKIEIGDTLKVLPGESIPTDGTIINGESSLDQSSLTGESLPVDKTVDDEIYGGTINLYGSFTMKATKTSKESSIQKLIEMVESSSPENAKVVRKADQWATLIVVIAFIAAVLTYLFTFEIERSVTILVVFCPCALVLATPTAIMATIGNLTKYGILVKDGQSIEELAHVDEIIFDKTGTLTHGTPQVVKVISDNKNEMMRLLASLESKSEHPIAKTIVRYYDNKDELLPVEDFKIHLGMGVSGVIDNCKIIAGNEKLFESEKKPLSSHNGETSIFVSKDSEIIGEVVLRDTLRKNAKSTIRNLKQLRIKTSLLSGDNANTAKRIADEVKIRNVIGDCLPEDKIEYIKREQILGHRVAMIGDGLNDAPALKKSNVGIAIGDIGSDLSIESCDMTLINGNIGNIPHLVKIAKKTIRTINIGIGFALILNISAMILAIMGVLNPIEGALIHNIGSVIVIIYASTLSGYNISNRNDKKLGLTKSLNKQMTKILTNR